jgi:hypothetical protein
MVPLVAALSPMFLFSLFFATFLSCDRDVVGIRGPVL